MRYFYWGVFLGWVGLLLYMDNGGVVGERGVWNRWIGLVEAVLN
jgi:hypothetical protein